MTCCQRLDAGDAGNNAIVERNIAAGDDTLENAERAVIKAGIAPDEEGSTLAFRQMFQKQPLVGRGNRVMPFIDAPHIAAVRRLA